MGTAIATSTCRSNCADRTAGPRSTQFGKCPRIPVHRRRLDRASHGMSKGSPSISRPTVRSSIPAVIQHLVGLRRMQLVSDSRTFRASLGTGRIRPKASITSLQPRRNGSRPLNERGSDTLTAWAPTLLNAKKLDLLIPTSKKERSRTSFGRMIRCAGMCSAKKSLRSVARNSSPLVIPINTQSVKVVERRSR